MLYILKDGKIIEKGSYLNLKKNKRSNFNKMLNAQKIIRNEKIGFLL